MAEISKSDSNKINEHDLYKKYSTIKNRPELLGLEVENFFVVYSSGLNASMISPKKSKELLKLYEKEKYAFLTYEEDGEKYSTDSFFETRQIISAKMEKHTAHLEYSSNIETAYSPINPKDSKELNSFLGFYKKTSAEQINLAQKCGIGYYPFAVPASFTVEDSQYNKINRERLNLQHQRRSENGEKNVILGLAASIQINVSYNSEERLKEILKRGYLLNPLIIAQTENSCGFSENEPNNYNPRPK